ncbi:MAG: 8-oxo-dGTP diphosphatase MutT [Glaciecola sp.]
MKAISIAVGVITKNNRFFVSRRNANQHQGNKWEFPGGKVDANEDVLTALCRELQEEIAIDVVSATPLIDIPFTYPDKTLTLHVYLVDNFTGDAHGAEGQITKWVTFSELCELTFPDANVAIIDKLRSLGYQ